jgi:hypothetical protein
MKKRITVSILFSLLTKAGFCQQDTWDIPATEILISQNKTNYSDHKTAKNNQLTSQATVSLWKKSTNQYKTVSDFIDKRLTSAFIVVADVSTLYNIYNQLSEMIEYERKSLEIVKKHPWTAAYMIGEQRRIINSGHDLFNYMSLLVISYNDLSKMKVSARKAIFHGIDLQLGVLRARCYSMYCMLNRLDITSEIGKTKPVQWVNKDEQIVKDILKNLK